MLVALTIWIQQEDVQTTAAHLDGVFAPDSPQACVEATIRLSCLLDHDNDQESPSVAEILDIFIPKACCRH